MVKQWQCFRIWHDDTQPQPYSVELRYDPEVFGLHCPPRFNTAGEARGWISLHHPGLDEC